MRVIVVGAGAVGSAVAFALADRGAEVILFERGPVADGASGAAAGMLAPLSEAPDGGPLLPAGLEVCR